jgi:hypothetical protein
MTGKVTYETNSQLLSYMIHILTLGHSQNRSSMNLIPFLPNQDNDSEAYQKSCGAMVTTHASHLRNP